MARQLLVFEAVPDRDNRMCSPFGDSERLTKISIKAMEEYCKQRYLTYRERIIAKNQSAKEIIGIAIVPSTNSALSRGSIPSLRTIHKVHRPFFV